jgi:uncharacterized SAM-binding protein YcdF (DUF218 family)
MIMGVLFNHAVSYITSPLLTALTMLAASAVFHLKGFRKSALWLLAAAFAWLWFFSSGVAYVLLGTGLEKIYPPTSVESLPKADAVVVLGGGVDACTNVLEYAEMYAGADRVAHAARIVKAGKAPLVIVSGEGEMFSSLPLLQEMGIDKDCIIVENESRNTEENAKYVKRLLSSRTEKPKVILVTSSWHMRRAELMFSRYVEGVEVIPSAIDYEATVYSCKENVAKWFLPMAVNLERNSAMVKEYIGYWGYRLVR